MDLCHICPGITCTQTSDLAIHVPLTRSSRRRYDYDCVIGFDMFMRWKKGEVRKIKVGQWRKRPNKASYALSNTTYEIPAPYHQLVCQLVAEDMHGADHDSHESRRRQTYAREILNAFGDELKEFKRSKLPPVDFRSRVLTPILQRQLNGIYDGYSYSARNAFPKEGEEPTIQDVTRFYLRNDPVDPIFIRTYRRNLLYLPNPRWHLHIVMGGEIGSTDAAVKHYNKVMANHDTIMRNLPPNSHERRDNNNIPFLNHTEVRCIIDEGLENFFKEELENVVRDTPSSTSTFLTG